MPLEFANAWMLYALWLVPIIGLIGLRHHQRGARILEQFIAPAMHRTMCSPPARRRFYWQWASLLCGCLLAIMAAARPQWGLREETVIQRGRDLIIALDVSRSMLAEDVHPNRLQRAKAVAIEKATPEQLWIRDLVARLPFGKVLVAIANKHARQLWAMLAREEDYDAHAWLKHPMVQRPRSTRPFQTA